MKLTLEPTTKVVHLNGVPARIWEGHTEDGIPVHAFITRVAVPESAMPEVHQRFSTMLQEQREPSPDVEAYPLRLVL